MDSNNFAQAVGYAIAFVCLIISYIHYLIVKCIYRNIKFKFKLAGLGMLLGIITCVLANIFFRIPMLFIYIFEEKENNFASFLTIVLSLISCFALSFFTYYFMSFNIKFIKDSELFEDYGSLVLSLGIYPIYIIFYFLINLLYFYYFYAKKFFIFINFQNELETTTFHIIVFTINIISLIICLYNGNICVWFYIKKKDKKTFIKCILFPSIITTIPFYSLFLYKININLIIIIIMCVICVVLSIVSRIKVFKEMYSESIPINISKEEEDDLVEYIDDRICLENFNKELNFEIPNSFSGINFGYKFIQQVAS